MSNPRELLEEDYKNKRGDLKHLDLKLSTGKKLRIFYSPVMNVDQQSAIYKHVNLSTGEMDTEIFLTSLIVRAMNEDGTRMFNDIDRKLLRTQADHNVLQEIAVKMGGVLESSDPKD